MAPQALQRPFRRQGPGSGPAGSSCGHCLANKNSPAMATGPGCSLCPGSEMAHFFTPLRDLVRNIRRLVALAWQNHKLLVIALGGLSVAGSGISFLRSGAVMLLINALAPVSGAARPGLATAVALAILASLVPDLIYSTLNYVDRRFFISLEQNSNVALPSPQRGNRPRRLRGSEIQRPAQSCGGPRDLPDGRTPPAQFSNLQNVVEFGDRVRGSGAR